MREIAQQETDDDVGSDTEINLLDPSSNVCINEEVLHQQIYMEDSKRKAKDIELPPPVIPKKRYKSNDKQSVNKRWTWSDSIVESLLYNLQEYKNNRSFEGVDFEADMGRAL